jgi:hypothetical protein
MRMPMPIDSCSIAFLKQILYHSMTAAQAGMSVVGTATDNDAMKALQRGLK